MPQAKNQRHFMPEVKTNVQFVGVNGVNHVQLQLPLPLDLQAENCINITPQGHSGLDNLPQPGKDTESPRCNASEIEGHADLLHAVGRMTRSFWEQVAHPKFYVYLPGDRFPADHSFADQKIREIIQFILCENVAMTIYHPVLDDTTSFSAVQIVPYLVAGLSEDQYTQIVIPEAPLRSCLLGTIVTRPCMPIIAPFVLTLGKTAVPTTSDGCRIVSEMIKNVIRNMRSPVNRKIQQAFDNIPKQFTTDAIFLTEYIANSVRVTSYDVVEKDSNGVQVRDGRFNIFVHPPSRDSRNYQEWIDVFRRQTQYIAIEDDELRPIEQIFCDHCTGCTHPTYLCPFLALPEFVVVHFPDRTQYNA